MSVLQGLGSSIVDEASVKVIGGCKELQGASETIVVESPVLSFVGRQGLALSSAPTVGVSSAEKHGRHDVVVLVGVGLAHDLADIWPPLLLGGPGVFDGGTFPNIFAVIATRRSRKLTRDSSNSSGRACAASHAAGSTKRPSTIVTALYFREQVSRIAGQVIARAANEWEDDYASNIFKR